MATKFESKCREYAFGATLTYAKITEDFGGIVRRGPLFKGIEALLEGEDAFSCSKRVNKRNVRTFSVRKYDILRFYDHCKGEATVLIDNETLGILRKELS